MSVKPIHFSQPHAGQTPEQITWEIKWNFPTTKSNAGGREASGDAQQQEWGDGKKPEAIQKMKSKMSPVKKCLDIALAAGRVECPEGRVQ